MKKKISVFILLFVLFFTCFVPSDLVMAQGVGEYSEDVAAVLETISSEMRATMEEYPYIIGCDLNYPHEIYLIIYDSGEIPLYVQSFSDVGRERLAGVTSSGVKCNGRRLYFTSNGEWYQQATGKIDIYSSSYDAVLYATNLEEYYDTNWNLISNDIPTIEEFLGEDTYPFTKWCVDAGLKCHASSNESASVIPYSFNSYFHIVRKSSSGKWLLTTIGNSVLQDNMDDYRLYVGENGNLHLASIYSGDDVNGYKINVRQYEYDTDGWLLRSYETLDTRDSSGIVDLGSGSGFDDTRVLAYTSESIYDHNGSVPLYEKSTEYFDVTNTPDTPDESDNPTSTPSNPNGGSGSEGGGTGGGTRPESPDIGGDVEPGGGLDFIISLFTKIWTDICSVNMSVDGYSISLQQIIVYGALVSIVGGFIMHFIFGRK